MNLAEVWKRAAATSERDALDAARYRWLREQVRDEEDTVEVQAFFWNTSKPREFDEWVNAAMAETSAQRAQPEAPPVLDGPEASGSNEQRNRS